MREFQKDVTATVLHWMARGLQMDPQRLAASPALRELMQPYTQWMGNAPCWMQFTGLLLAKKCQEWSGLPTEIVERVEAGEVPPPLLMHAPEADDPNRWIPTSSNHIPMATTTHYSEQPIPIVDVDALPEEEMDTSFPQTQVVESITLETDQETEAPPPAAVDDKDHGAADAAGGSIPPHPKKEKAKKEKVKKEKPEIPTRIIPKAPKEPTKIRLPPVKKEKAVKPNVPSPDASAAEEPPAKKPKLPKKPKQHPSPNPSDASMAVATVVATA